LIKINSREDVSGGGGGEGARIKKGGVFEIKDARVSIHSLLYGMRGRIGATGEKKERKRIRLKRTLPSSPYQNGFPTIRGEGSNKERMGLNEQYR